MRQLHVFLAAAALAVATLALQAQQSAQQLQPADPSEHLSHWVTRHADLTLPQLLDALAKEPGFRQLSPNIQQKELAVAAKLHKAQHPEKQPSHIIPAS
jgi:hypothetical protein